MTRVFQASSPPPSPWRPVCRSCRAPWETSDIECPIEGMMIYDPLEQFVLSWAERQEYTADTSKARVDNSRSETQGMITTNMTSHWS